MASLRVLSAILSLFLRKRKVRATIFVCLYTFSPSNAAGRSPPQRAGIYSARPDSRGFSAQTLELGSFFLCPHPPIPACNPQRVSAIIEFNTYTLRLPRLSRTIQRKLECNSPGHVTSSSRSSFPPIDTLSCRSKKNGSHQRLSFRDPLQRPPTHRRKGQEGDAQERRARR